MEFFLKRKKHIVIISISFFIVLLGCALFFFFKGNTLNGLSEKHIKNFPIVASFYNIDGQEIEAYSHDTLKNIYSSCNPKSEFVDPLYIENEQENLYKDEYGMPVLSPLRFYPSTKNIENDCQTEFYFLKQALTPVSFSVYVNKEDDLKDWFKNNSEVLQWKKTPIFQGFFHHYLTMAQFSGKDLGVESLKESIIQSLVEDALAAGSELHIDTLRGKQGLVFVFDKSKAKMAYQGLVQIVKSKSKVNYNISSVKNKVWEFNLASEKFYVLENSGRVFLSNSIYSLVNILKNKPLFNSKEIEGTVSVTLRLNAYLKSALNILTGNDLWQATFSFDLNRKISKPHSGYLDNARIFESLVPRISDGVLYSIPKDIFTVVALSFPIPNPLNPTQISIKNKNSKFEYNKDYFKSKSEESGVALVWDLNGKNSAISNIGLIIANNENSRVKSEQDFTLLNIGTKQNQSLYCKRGNTWLLASNVNLLTRMKESCEGYSQSILSLPGNTISKFRDNQALVLVNTQTFIEQVYASGKGDMDVLKSIPSLPTFGYFGSKKNNFILSGFLVSKERLK